MCATASTYAWTSAPGNQTERCARAELTRINSSLLSSSQARWLEPNAYENGVMGSLCHASIQTRSVVCYLKFYIANSSFGGSVISDCPLICSLIIASRRRSPRCTTPSTITREFGHSNMRQVRACECVNVCVLTRMFVVALGLRPFQKIEER